MSRSSYPLSCLLPSDTIFSLLASTKSIVKLDENEVEDVESRMEKILENEITYSDGDCRKTLTYAQVGELFQFEYQPFLKFLHVKEARNLWLNEIVLEEGCEQLEVISVNGAERIQQLMCRGFIHPQLSIRFIGMVDGIDVGHGLFAEEKLPAHQFLGEYVGLVSTLYSVTDRSYCCEFPSCDGGMTINALAIGNMVRFINHSEKPNAKFMRWYCDGMMHVICVGFILLENF
jgi:hypothetical protein